MCVIMVADTTRPTPEMVAQGYSANDHGAGIAWRGADQDGPYIEYHKGIKDLPYIQKLVAEAPLPFVVHFRIASIGGPLRCLTHPFLVQPNMPGDTVLSGRTRSSVLFHNGTWGAWRTTLVDMAIKGCWKIPPGAWSDSRAMAFIASHVGIGFLEFLGSERILVFDPAENDETDGINFLGETRWNVVENVTCSNNFFCYRSADWRKTDNRQESEGKGPIVLPPVKETRFDGKGKEADDDDEDYEVEDMSLPVLSPFRRPLVPPIKPEDQTIGVEEAKKNRIAAARSRAAGKKGTLEVVPDKAPFRRGKKGHRQALWRNARTLSEAKLWYDQSLLSKNQYKHAVLNLKGNWYIEQEKLRLEHQRPRPIIH